MKNLAIKQLNSIVKILESDIVRRKETIDEYSANIKTEKTQVEKYKDSIRQYRDAIKKLQK